MTAARSAPPSRSDATAR